MEFGQRPVGFMKFLKNNNEHAVNKMKWIATIPQRDLVTTNSVIYIYTIYIYYIYKVYKAIRQSAE